MFLSGDVLFSLTADSLVRNGFLFKESVGLFSCELFADWWQANQQNFGKNDFDLKSRGTQQSFPKDARSRRLLTFPNPQHFVHLAEAVEKHWSEVLAYSQNSKISISRLEDGGYFRAVGYFRSRDEQIRERVLRRVGKRYYLHVDIARFFPSVYLHRLETIFPGTNGSGYSNGLGSKLDNLSRRMQGNESIRLPLGPDTSFVLAEVLASYIDTYLPPNVSAVRHVDDISIYSDTIPQLEKSLTGLRSACEGLRLELNSLKTFQGELPDEMEPDWKSQLRALASSIKSDVTLITFFDRSLSLHKKNRDNGLINYAISSSYVFGLEERHWTVFEAFLLTILLLEPRSVVSVGRFLRRAQLLGRNMHIGNIISVYRKFILQHAKMNHGFEVNQALWTLFKLSLVKHITPTLWATIAEMTDSFVAVTSLWLRDQGFSVPKKLPSWTKLASQENGYTGENWLLCHEARVHDWLSSPATPTSNFWHQAVKNEISFVDGTAGILQSANKSVREDVLPEPGLVSTSYP